MKFKDGVSVDGITKECISGMFVAEEVIKLYYNREMVITSVTDGKHKEGSKHYEGNAFDIRTWTSRTSGKQMSTGAKRHLAYLIGLSLGDDWDLVAEPTHLHIEYDP